MAAWPSCCCSTGLSDQHTLHTAWYYRYCSIAPAHVPQSGAHRAQRRGAGHRTRAAASSRKQIACHPAARRRHAGDAAGHEPRRLAVGVPHLRPAVHRDRDAAGQVQDVPGRAPVCGRRRESVVSESCVCCNPSVVSFVLVVGRSSVVNLSSRHHASTCMTGCINCMQGPSSHTCVVCSVLSQVLRRMIWAAHSSVELQRQWHML